MKNINLNNLSHEELIDLVKKLDDKLKVKTGLVYELDELSVIEKMKYKDVDFYPNIVINKNKTIFADSNPKNHYLINGDNYNSIGLLHYTHKESIDVIYIDPPYNTGNEDFVYNDAFVSKEDTYRHSKWLNFMEKRLRLAIDLLSDKGIIFISIDENEYATLKLLCDSIFREENFVENFIWKKNSNKNQSILHSGIHEYILCYAKNKELLNSNFFKIKKPGFEDVMSIRETFLEEKRDNNSLNEEDLFSRLKEFYKKNSHLKGIKEYKFVEPGSYRIYARVDISAPGTSNKSVNVLHPITKKVCQCTKSNGRSWAYDQEAINKLLEKNHIYFGDDEKTLCRLIKYLDEVEIEPCKSIIEDSTNGTTELEKILGNKFFDYPKPVSLIKKLISLIPNKNAIVLDFFAGSGTTGHAVLELNKIDGGNRKFILCTNNENNICEKVTYPRLAKVIKKDYSENNLLYFDTLFNVPVSKCEYQHKKNISDKMIHLVALKENCFVEIVQEVGHFVVMANPFTKKILGIYYGEPDLNYVNKIKLLLENNNYEKSILYGFRFENENDLFGTEFEEITESVVKKAYPMNLDKILKEIFK